ncbi:hypothetical protein J6590_019644 [Homalodisca vitripennis]|nr:hypothetical protein J6590_019644 [Homalodisca vitripennis]
MEVDLDANNNSTDKKGYSLRPRCAIKPADADDIPEDARKPRGRVQRPSKSKSLPLSKYRRKTANARERSRMREINEAFETLRKSIPLISTKCDNPSEKNTKISTLRLAMKYITVLSNALRDSDGESDKDSILSEYTLTPPDFRDSYTPTSTSDNSDFSESFLVTNLPRESPAHCVSPFSSSSSFNLSDDSSRKKTSAWNISLEKSDYTASTCDGISDSEKNNLQIVTGSYTTSTANPPPYQISSRSALEDLEVLDPSPSYTSQLTPLVPDSRFAGLTPISLQLQSIPVLEDWDDLNFSKVDFDEFLST